MILQALNSLWHFIASSASVATIVGGIAVAIAILLPKQLDWITDLRKWAVVVAVCAFGYTFTYSKGYIDGLAVKQAQWDAALSRETGDGETARSDAERTVGPVSPSRELLRSDPFNRNRGERAGSK
jgi:hypothetical protein